MYKVIFYKTARNEEPIAKYLNFFFEKDYIVITHGFTKKTDQVPEAELTRANTYREDFKAQIVKGETYEPKKI